MRMAIKRITLSVPARTAARLKRAAGTSSVSAWVTQVVEERLEDEELERQWQAFLRDVALTREDMRRAGTKYKQLMSAGRRRRAA